MRIAYFSPLNPLPTGISDYSEELLPALAELAEVHVYVSGFTPTNPHVRQDFTGCAFEEYPARHAERPYDANLYHMGNSLHHAEIFRMVMRYPGIVVLHDTILHHFFLELAARDNDPTHYLREMLYDHGPDGLARGLEVLGGVTSPPFFDYPLLGRIAEVSLGIIVHSRYARDQVAHYRDDNVAVVPPHIIPPPAFSMADVAAMRLRHGIRSGDVLFGSFGVASPPKRLEVALRAFARLREQFSAVHFLIVGPVSPPGWLELIVDDLQLQDFVTITGAVPFDDFISYIAAADVCLNLRHPTAGETSASLLRILGAGRPAIVSDVGSFREFPDYCVLKVPVDSEEESRLFDCMRRLAIDEELRQNRGQRAHEYVLTRHSPRVTAKAYVEAVERMLTDSDGIGPGKVGLPDGLGVGEISNSRSISAIRDRLQSELSGVLSEIGLL